MVKPFSLEAPPYCKLCNKLSAVIVSGEAPANKIQGPLRAERAGNSCNHVLKLGFITLRGPKRQNIKRVLHQHFLQCIQISFQKLVVRLHQIGKVSCCSGLRYLRPLPLMFPQLGRCFHKQRMLLQLHLYIVILNPLRLRSLMSFFICDNCRYS